MTVQLELMEDAGVTPGTMDDVRDLLDAHAGAAAVELMWSDGNGTRVRFKSRRNRMAVTAASLGALRALLGSERVRLVRGG